MPIYEYKCNHCEKTFETLVLGSDVPSCPACNSQDLARLLSCCGFVTKGAGAANAASSPSSSTSSCSGCTATSCASCSG
ncbi:FmdB family zinc ribbon protein [Desulfocicer vacuolatum]|uniref:FmdB family zinc ribbon protein n=1 Tax=Desulfocicer vacuolatum TaxID=2298 RepID=UPI0009FF938A|nr:zinc ribbon domain-containing protein [Desulfocicer vacuolatum]